MTFRSYCEKDNARSTFYLIDCELSIVLIVLLYNDVVLGAQQSALRGEGCKYLNYAE